MTIILEILLGVLAICLTAGAAYTIGAKFGNWLNEKENGGEK